MSIKLTDAHLTMLNAAAQRDDRCLVTPQKLKGRAAQKCAAKLIGAGLAKEIKAKAGMPVWRRDEAAVQSYALKLTVAGAKAIVADEGSAPPEVEEKASGRHPVVLADALSARQASPDASTFNPSPSSQSPPAAPRSGTKIARVIELLNRNSGATLDELIATTGWLPHTTRATLTGLRKRGYPVALDRSNTGQGSAYRIRTDQSAGGADGSSGNYTAGNKDTVRDDDLSASSAAL